MKAENIRLQELKMVLRRLEEALALPKNDVVRDSVIQRFEFTVELSWKALQKSLQAAGLPEVLGPKNVFREAAQINLVQNPEAWIQFIDDRNLSSHTYRETLAEQVYASAQKLPPFVHALVAAIEEAL